MKEQPGQPEQDHEQHNEHQGHGGGHDMHGTHVPDAEGSGTAAGDTSDAGEHHAHASHDTHAGMHGAHAGPSGDAEKHGEHVDHTGHELMFRNRFWVCLVLAIPVLLYSETVQGWLGFTMPTFNGDRWITPAFSVIVFLYDQAGLEPRTWEEEGGGQ